MSEFKSINFEDYLSKNIVNQLNNEWCLITAGKIDSYNTMTASWGGFGILWHRQVAFIFIRPNRYTYEFTEKNKAFSISFFPKQYKDILTFCGRNSGRQVDKMKLEKISPIEINNTIAFNEAELVFTCNKLYADNLKPELFLDTTIEKEYPKKQYHKLYIGEITGCLTK